MILEIFLISFDVLFQFDLVQYLQLQMYFFIMDLLILFDIYSLNYHTISLSYNLMQRLRIS